MIKVISIWSSTRLAFRTISIKIDLIELFFECDDSEIATYADGTTPHSCANDIPNIIMELQPMARKLCSWFTNNHMKVNPSKCHIILNI